MNSKAFKQQAFIWLFQIKGRIAEGAYPSTAFMIAYELATECCNEEHGGAAWPSCATLGKEVGKSEQYVVALVHKMEAGGDLRVEWGKRGCGHSNRYWMIVKPHWAEVYRRKKTSAGRAKKPQPSFEKPQPAEVNLVTNHEAPSRGRVKNAPHARERDDVLSHVSDPGGAGGALEGRPRQEEISAPQEIIEPEAPQNRTVTVYEPQLIMPGEDYATIAAIWQRPWIDDPAADRKAFALACREVTPEIIIEAATGWAQVVEARFLPPLAKWLTARGWEKAPPAKGHAARRRAPQRRNGGKVEITKVFFRQAGWRQNADGSLTCPKTGRTWGAAQ